MNRHPTPFVSVLSSSPRLETHLHLPQVTAHCPRAIQERERERRLARSMDSDSSSPSSPSSSLRHKLRTTVCGCFGGGGAGAPAGGERVRWRRRAAAGEFRYDPLSYALNFDEGTDDGSRDHDAFLYRNFNSRLPPSPASAPAAQRPTAIAIA